MGELLTETIHHTPKCGGSKSPALKLQQKVGNSLKISTEIIGTPSAGKSDYWQFPNFPRLSKLAAGHQKKVVCGDAERADHRCVSSCSS